MLEVRHEVARALLITAALLSLLAVDHRSAQADSASAPLSGIGEAIFGERDRLPIDVAQLSDGSIILLSVFFKPYSRDNQFVVHRLDAAGRVIWRTFLSARGDLPKGVPATATSGLEYRDEASLLDLWDLSSSDDDLLDTHLIASIDAEHDPVIVGDSLLGLWALSGDGRLLWHRHLFEPLGLSLLTALARSSDGSILLGGSGVRVGGRCDAATVMKLDREGRLVWQWHSGYELLAEATRVVPLADGGVALLVDSLNPNRYLAGYDLTSCRPFREGYRRLVWLNQSGHETRQITVPSDVYVEGMTILPDGSIAIVGWRAGVLLFRRFSADGKRVLHERVYDVRRLFGWTKEISPWFVDITAAVGADIVFIATFYCPNSVWPCLGRGVRAIQFAPDGRLRRMPDREFTEPILETRDPDANAILIFSPGGIERLPAPQVAE